MVTYASIISMLVFIYFTYRYIKSVNRSENLPDQPLKMLLFAALVLFFGYPFSGWMSYLFTGAFDRTEHPALLIYSFWFGLIYLGIMLNWLILHDILLPVVKKFSGKQPQILQQKFAKLFLLISLLTLLYTGGRLFWDTTRITTEEITYKVQQESFSPLTIVHIADLHADPYTSDQKMQKYIDRVNAADPDIVLFGGDLISSGTDYIDAGARALGAIDATYGTYAVLGDHDYWTDAELISEALMEYDIEMLRNENRWIDHNGEQIKISGITEIYSSKVLNEQLESLLSDTRNESFSLLFAHQASDRLIERSLFHGVDQIFGAHTHGGQLRIPVFFYPATAVREETKYVNGHWLLDGMLLNVNSGLGFTLSPVRYNAPAQVSVIRIVSK
jgi:predicted MPP superfamily phosphohydrolase